MIPPVEGVPRSQERVTWPLTRAWRRSRFFLRLIGGRLRRYVPSLLAGAVGLAGAIWALLVDRPQLEGSTALTWVAIVWLALLLLQPLHAAAESGRNFSSWLRASVRARAVEDRALIREVQHSVTLDVHDPQRLALALELLTRRFVAEAEAVTPRPGDMPFRYALLAVRGAAEPGVETLVVEWQEAKHWVLATSQSIPSSFIGPRSWKFSVDVGSKVVQHPASEIAAVSKRYLQAMARVEQQLDMVQPENLARADPAIRLRSIHPLVIQDTGDPYYRGWYGLWTRRYIGSIVSLPVFLPNAAGAAASLHGWVIVMAREPYVFSMDHVNDVLVDLFAPFQTMLSLGMSEHREPWR